MMLVEVDNGSTDKTSEKTAFTLSIPVHKVAFPMQHFLTTARDPPLPDQVLGLDPGGLHPSPNDRRSGNIDAPGEG